MEGHGKRRWPCGRCYRGEWRQDMMWGEGQLTWPTGESYTGQFRKGAFHGRGIRVWPGGDRYVGEFDSGEQEGSGTFQSAAEGWVFEGQWMHGRMYGKGRMKWPEDIAYVGEWRDGVREGHGRMTWPDGSWYEGPFQRNHIEGHGQKTFADGAWFEGEFHDGEFDGHGTFHWPDGTEFEGLWRQSEITGPGCHRFPGGTTITGTFEDGGASGEGMKRWACGCVYTGTLLNNRIHQYGTFRWPDGRCYVGHFEDDAMHGEGTLSWSDSGGLCTYRGEFRYNAFEGRGVLEWSSGARFDGEFHAGLYDGEGCFEWPGRGSVYRGHWALGEMCGQGMFECNGGDSSGSSYVYVGAFRQGHMEGIGQLSFRLTSGDYDEYLGDFHFSRFTGTGSFSWGSGASLEGLFEDGYCNRVGRKVYVDGRVYTGELRYDLEHGKGVMSEPGGRNFVALWHEGKPVKELLESCAPELHLTASPCGHGGLFFQAGGRSEERGGLTDNEDELEAKARVGSPAAGKGSLRPVLPVMDKRGEPMEGKAIVVYLNGDRYIGHMRAGRKHGRGMYVYADLMTYSGVWEDDVLEGVQHPVMQDVLPVEVRKLHGNREIVGAVCGGEGPWVDTLGSGAQTVAVPPGRHSCAAPHVLGP